MGKDNIEYYPIRDGMAFGSYSFNDENFDDVKNKLSKLNPGAVGNASTAYKEAAEVLAEMTDLLQNDYAKRIVKFWEGKVAQEALDQLGKVYKTAGKLSDDSHRNAQLYSWYKTNILDWYHTTGKTMEDGYIHTDGDDEAARKLMQKFNARMNEAFEGHPLKIERDLPKEIGAGGDDPRTKGPGGPGGPGGLPKGGGGGLSPGSSSLPTTDGAGAFPRGDGSGSFTPGGPGGSNPFAPGDVSPFNPPGAGGPHLSPGSGTDGGPFGGTPKTDLSSFPGGGPGGMPGGLSGGGAGGGFGADPGGFGGGAGAGGGIGAGGPGAGPGLGGAGRNAAGMRGGMPMGGMPMAPGGGQGGGQNEERERNTWLTEDEDVWGADDDTAPPVIG